MLQYKNFKFNDKQDFVDYIEKRMTDYWKNHNDSFSRVCEELDDYFYFDGYGNVCSTDEKEYFNSVSYSEVFKKLMDTYDDIFTDSYGHAYYTLFDDIDNIMNMYDEDEIQENMNDDYYEYLFDDDEEDFFLNDELAE